MIYGDRELLVVVNPNSTRYDRVQREVLDRLGDAGVKFTGFATPSSKFEGNVEELGVAITKESFVVCAAGDGTANQIATAILDAGLNEVPTLQLPYGGFNDGGKHNSVDMLWARSDQVRCDKAFPIKLSPDSSDRFRYAIRYGSIGAIADIAGLFGELDSRESLQNAPEVLRKPLAMAQLFGGFLKHRDSHEMNFDGRSINNVMFINGNRMAGLTTNHRDFGLSDENFGYGELNTASLVELGLFGVMCLARLMPVYEVTSKTLKFTHPTDIIGQADGETFSWPRVSELTAQKSSSDFITVVSRRTT